MEVERVEEVVVVIIAGSNYILFEFRYYYGDGEKRLFGDLVRR